MANHAENEKKPIYKKWWFWLIIIIIIGIIAGSQGTGSNTTQQTSTNTNNSVASEDTKITLEEFNQIQTGMTYEKVVEIIGAEGTVLSETDVTGDAQYKTTMYSWEGKGNLGANANITFQAGKVVSKAQFGLE